MCPGEREVNGLRDNITSLLGGIQDAFEVPGSEFRVRSHTVFVSSIPVMGKLNMFRPGVARYNRAGETREA